MNQLQQIHFTTALTVMAHLPFMTNDIDLDTLDSTLTWLEENNTKSKVTFHSRHIFNNNQKEHTQTSSSSSKLYSCPVCYYSSYNYEAYLQHMNANDHSLVKIYYLQRTQNNFEWRKISTDFGMEYPLTEINPMFA